MRHIDFSKLKGCFSLQNTCVFLFITMFMLLQMCVQADNTNQLPMYKGKTPQIQRRSQMPDSQLRYRHEHQHHGDHQNHGNHYDENHHHEQTQTNHHHVHDDERPQHYKKS